MSERMITLAEAQQMLESLSAQPAEETLIITHNDQPALTLMSYQAHQALLANIESLQNILESMLGGNKKHPSQQAKKAVKSARHTSWEEFQKEVGWE